ncbi:MAG: HAD family hydrolase [Thermoguttaceae bacterium]|jgi:phosphoglycolate phosphatase
MTVPFKAVVFDLDGTLLDTLDDLAEATNAALRALGFAEHPRESYKIFVGDGVEALIRRVVPEGSQNAATLDRSAALMRAEYGRRWDHKTRPYEGVPELLRALAARRIAAAVLSNKPEQFVRLCVERLLPQASFAVVLGASPAWARKPDPAGAREIARRLALPPAEMLYLGDTNTDMQTAVAAGMFPAGALWGFRTAEELLANGARVLVEKPLDLLTFFPES